MTGPKSSLCRSASLALHAVVFATLLWSPVVRGEQRLQWLSLETVKDETPAATEAAAEQSDAVSQAVEFVEEQAPISVAIAPVMPEFDESSEPVVANAQAVVPAPSTEVVTEEAAQAGPTNPLPTSTEQPETFSADDLLFADHLGESEHLIQGAVVGVAEAIVLPEPPMPLEAPIAIEAESELDNEQTAEQVAPVPADAFQLAAVQIGPEQSFDGDTVNGDLVDYAMPADWFLGPAQVLGDVVVEEEPPADTSADPARQSTEQEQKQAQEQEQEQAPAESSVDLFQLAEIQLGPQQSFAGDTMNGTLVDYSMPADWFLGPAQVLGDIVDAPEQSTQAPTSGDLEVQQNEDTAEQVATTPAADVDYLADLDLTTPDAEIDFSQAVAEIAQVAENLDASLEETDSATQVEEAYPWQDDDYTEASNTLTLDEVLEAALMNNPEVGMALAREEQARWLYQEAQAYRYPTVDLIAEGGPEYNRPATNTSGNEDITGGRNLTFRVVQLLYDGGTSTSESDRRMQVRRSSELETRIIVEEIVNATADAYTAVLQYQRASAAAEEFVEEMQAIVDQITVMHDSGAASKLELDFAKARLASAVAETGNTKAQLNDALSDLEFLTGPLPEFTAVPPRDIGSLSVSNLQSYEEQAREQNAEVLLNQSNKQAVRHKIRAQRGQYSPIFSLNFKSEALADEGGSLPARNTTELKLKAEYFLLDGGVRRSRINRTKAQLKELEWEDERIYKEINRRVQQAYNQITTNRITLDATESEIESNFELRRLNRQNLEMGEISIIELIEVEERLFNSQANWYRLRSEMFENYYELLVAAGDLAALVGDHYTKTRIEDER